MTDLDFLACPNCKNAPLQLEGDRSAISALRCDVCESSYAIRNGIPRFVPETNYADSFGFQWNKHDVTQLDSHCSVDVSKDRVFGVTQWPSEMPDQTILEAGSGAGRFTEILVKTGARVFSFDYSNAVEANQRSNGTRENLTIFQGDIFNIPTKRGVFDKVFCLGVLQHTPDPQAAFKSLATCVRPGGELVIDVYAKDLAARLQWKYILRPLTKRMNQQRLYSIISAVTPPLVPLTKFARKIAGRTGARLSPIVEYSYLGLTPEQNRQWAVLDTFDMYSPAHDHPQSVETVKSWFRDIGFENVEVRRGPNGVVGKGTRPQA